MSFYWDAFKDFILMEKTRQPDGEGGYVVSWTDGATVKVSLDVGSPSEVRRAMAEGLKTVFTISMPMNSPLEYGDYVKSKDDGTVYKVTSSPNDNQTPPEASLSAKYATAERTELPQ